jgi:hypothetical protein
MNINSRIKFWNDGSKKHFYIRFYYFEGHKQFIFYNIKKHILIWNGINLLLIFTLISSKSPPQSTSKYQNKKSVKVVRNVETIKMLKLINRLKDCKIETIAWKCALTTSKMKQLGLCSTSLQLNKSVEKFNMKTKMNCPFKSTFQSPQIAQLNIWNGDISVVLIKPNKLQRLIEIHKIHHNPKLLLKKDYSPYIIVSSINN